jgi:hypothetical protein
LRAKATELVLFVVTEKLRNLKEQVESNTSRRTLIKTICVHNATFGAAAVVLCFLASFLPFTSFQAALHVLGARFSRQFY